MENKNLKSFSFAKAICKIFGHKLEVSKNVTDHIHEYKCAKCGLELTDTANGFIARLTPKFKETNEYIRKIHKKRCQRVYANHATS